MDQKTERQELERHTNSVTRRGAVLRSRRTWLALGATLVLALSAWLLKDFGRETSKTFSATTNAGSVPTGKIALSASPSASLNTGTPPAARLRRKAHSLAVPGIDAGRVGKLRAALDSGSVDEQIEAIPLLARIGDSEEQAVIVDYARNSQADVGVRVVALENMDWSEHLDVVTHLVRSDPEVGEATLYLAAQKDLSPEAVAALTDTVAESFGTYPDPSFQLAALKFLLDRHSDQFDALAAQANLARYSPTETDDFTQLVRERNEEKEFLEGTQQPN